MKKALPYIIFIVVAVLVSMSFSFSEKRLEIARESAKRAQEACFSRAGIPDYEKANYCSCMRDYSENIGAPHSLFDRATFGYFWSRQEALEKHSEQLARCKTGNHAR